MKFLKIMLSLLTIFLLFMFINMYKFGYDLKDGFFRTLSVSLFMEGTVFAAGFSEEAFSKVKLDMDFNQVLELLGEPLQKDTDCQKWCFWTYTWQNYQTDDFDQRWVIFGPDLKVVEIRKSFFID